MHFDPRYPGLGVAINHHGISMMVMHGRLAEGEAWMWSEHLYNS